MNSWSSPINTALLRASPPLTDGFPPSRLNKSARESGVPPPYNHHSSLKARGWLWDLRRLVSCLPRWWGAPHPKPPPFLPHPPIPPSRGTCPEDTCEIYVPPKPVAAAPQFLLASILFSFLQQKKNIYPSTSSPEGNTLRGGGGRRWRRQVKNVTCKCGRH